MPTPDFQACLSYIGQLNAGRRYAGRMNRLSPHSSDANIATLDPPVVLCLWAKSACYDEKLHHQRLLQAWGLSGSWNTGGTLALSPPRNP